MIELIGWISSISFAVCAIPQAWQAYRDGHADGVNNLFLFFWILGEIAGIVYVSILGSYPLIFNYSFNAIFLGVIVYYKRNPREPKALAKSQGN